VHAHARTSRDNSVLSRGAGRGGGGGGGGGGGRGFWFSGFGHAMPFFSLFPVPAYLRPEATGSTGASPLR